MKEKALLMFDGVCNLCNGSVRFVHNRDKDDQFRFLSFQSEQGKELMKSYGYEPGDMSSVVLVYQGKLFNKTCAVIKTLQLLGFPYNLASFLFVIPKKLRDPFYTIIAKNRYRLMGKQKEVCEYNPDFQKKMQWNP